MRWIKHLAIALCWLSAATTAFAGDDGYGLGDGHRGALSVDQQNQTINVASAIMQPVALQATQVSVGDAALFHAGDLVLLWHTTGPSSAAPGDNAAIDVSPEQIGAYEFARVTSVAAPNLMLDRPTLRAYPALESQVVFVPELRSLQVQAGASLVALPWDPAQHAGGILIVFVNGHVQLEGALSANAAGMRGGAYVADAAPGTGCSDLILASPAGGARGEGLGHPY